MQVLTALGLIIVGWFLIWLYATVDESGWIFHSRETAITARADWLIGENKTCTSYPLGADEAKLWKDKLNSVTHKINCDDGPEHEIAVTFLGRTERPDARAHDSGVQWRCVKRSESFTCYALN
jgi:hypothetical protein